MRRCDNWIRSVRCDRDGVVRLVAPTGELVPGGPVCRHCAEQIIVEYSEKLGERWTSREESDDRRKV